jgi:acyl dehydratase
MATVHPAELGRFFEDFVVGDVYQHPFGRTINEADSTWFTLLTCNTNQNHFNAHLAQSNPITGGRIIVNSGLTVALVLGLSVIDMSQNAVANLGWDDIKLTHPVYVGDTMYAESICLETRESSSRPTMGIITMRTADKNGQVMGARQVLPKDDVMLVSDKGQMIRVHVGEISEQGRNTQGVRVMNVSSGEKVVSFEYMAEESVVVSEEASDAAQEGPVQ